MVQLMVDRHLNRLWERTGQVKEFLYIKHQASRLVMGAVRVNGYLMDLFLIEAGRTYHYPLRQVSPELEVAVEEVVADVDLLLPENKTYRQFEFFKTLSPDEVIVPSRSA